MDEDILASLSENGIPAELLERVAHLEAHAPSLQQYGVADASFAESFEPSAAACSRSWAPPALAACLAAAAQLPLL